MTNSDYRWFSKPPPSATRPPLQWLKALALLRFPVNPESADSAVGAANNGLSPYKFCYSAFTPRSPWGFWRHLALLAAISAALPASLLLWHAPLCTGWQPSDRCAIAGGAKVRAVNTTAAGYSR